MLTNRGRYTANRDKWETLGRTSLNKNDCLNRTRAQCYKTFYVRNLRKFVISQSVCLWQAFTAQPNVCQKCGAYPSGAPKRRSSLGQTLSITHKRYTRLESLARGKHSNLLRTFVNYGRKKFYNIGPSSKSPQIKQCELAQLTIEIGGFAVPPLQCQIIKIELAKALPVDLLPVCSYYNRYKR